MLSIIKSNKDNLTSRLILKEKKNYLIFMFIQKQIEMKGQPP